MGPILVFISIFFEDANEKLLTYFHGTREVAHQIFRSFIGGAHLRKLVSLYVNVSSVNVIDVIDCVVSIAAVCKHATKFGENIVCLGFPSQRTLTAVEKVTIQNVLLCSHFSSDEITRYRRILVIGNLLHTESYSCSVRHSDCYFSVLNRTQTYVLCSIIFIEFCMSVDCNVAHDMQTAVMLLGYPVTETVLQTYDSELKVNLSAHIRKAVVSCTVAAVNATESLSKLCMVSDSENRYLIPIPVFELD